MQRRSADIASPAPETVVREYRRRRDYERDARVRRKDGWRAISVLQRPAAGFPRADTEYLVTYQRIHQAPAQRRPLDWLAFPHHPHLPRSRPTRWLWLALGAILLILLAYGLIDFFADALRV